MAPIWFTLFLFAFVVVNGFDHNRFGADVNHTIGLNAGAQFDTSAVNTVHSSGAKWVRLNFIVKQGWSGPDDPQFIATYDSIIKSYQAAGISVYGLIGAQSVAGGYDRNNPGNFVDPFQSASVSIINRFQYGVQTFELFNEPNDWAGGNQAQVSPYWFARFIEVVYEQKYNLKWNVNLISGPLFSWDGDTGQDYIYQTYVQGMTQLSWDWFHQNAGTYPLDGIGYHIYVAQGSTDPGTISQAVMKNVNAVWQGVTSGENYRGLEPSVSKQLWVSEIGWPEQAVGEDGQASDLETAYQALRDFRIRLTLWFTLQDFQGPNLWGLIDLNGNKRKSWDSFVKVAQKYN